MSARARLTVMLAASLVLLAALAVVVFHGSGTNASGSTFEGGLPPANLPPHDFALRDQDGHPVRLAAYRGRAVILTFLYSTCRDTCPLTAQQIRLALDDVGRDIPVLAVSVDPVNDTPLNARRFVARQSLTGRMRFLLGTRAQLAPIWKAYGIQSQSRAFEHSAYVLLIDRRGVQRVDWPVSELTPEGLAHDLRLLTAAGSA